MSVDLPRVRRSRPAAAGCDHHSRPQRREGERQLLSHDAVASDLRSLASDLQQRRSPNLLMNVADVARLLPECDADDDDDALKALVPTGAPSVLMLTPASGTYFPAEYPTVLNHLTVFYPSCGGEPSPLWDSPTGGIQAAIRLHLRFLSFFGKSFDKSFVAGRCPPSRSTCCAAVCPKHWCRACTYAWALNTLSGFRGSSTR